MELGQPMNAQCNFISSSQTYTTTDQSTMILELDKELVCEKLPTDLYRIYIDKECDFSA